MAKQLVADQLVEEAQRKTGLTRFDGAGMARVVWALQDRVIWGPERPSITGYGHYHERWVRRDGAWKLAALKLTRLHMDVHPPTAQP